MIFIFKNTFFKKCYKHLIFIKIKNDVNNSPLELNLIVIRFFKKKNIALIFTVRSLKTDGFTLDLGTYA